MNKYFGIKRFLSRTKIEYMRCGFSTTRHDGEGEGILDGLALEGRLSILEVNAAKRWGY